MEKIIVTSGHAFTDIDALACAISYSELLRLKGKKAKAILPGPLNKTVTEKIKKWNLDYSCESNLDPTDDYFFVLVDISDQGYFAKFVRPEKIIEIFDHRSGSKNLWKKRLKNNSHIELVGACATLIWEEFKKAKKDSEISEISANLISTAIIANTLNFQASVTTSRDRKAFEELSKYTKLPKDWARLYFRDKDKEIDKDIESSIRNDLKGPKPFIAQLELWNAKRVISKHHKKIVKIMQSYDPTDWFLTAPSISESKNYLIAQDKKIKKILQKNINVKFAGDIGTTNKLWLRKEIVQRIKC
jgi:nanoRNase/pAp phosphatase (c-di-AMP/oligoRNAs hydrolase)